MKKIAKIILQYYLYFLAKLVLWRTKPFIIVVAGTTNRTFTKQAIESFLRVYSINEAVPSFNTEIGLPLAILGLKSGYNSYRRWLKSVISAPFKSLTNKLPKVAVFEFGTNRPGDLAYLVSLAVPKIVVITSLTQRYLDQFGGIDKMAHEYEALIKSVKPNGLVILNSDIPEVRRLQTVSKARVEFFSVQEENASNIDNTWLVTNFKTQEQGIAGHLINNNHKEDFSIKYFGKHHAYAYASAKAVIANLLTNKIL